MNYKNNFKVYYFFISIIFLLIALVFVLIFVNKNNFTIFQNFNWKISNNNYQDKNVFKTKVIKVIDGDTIEIENGDKVRYLNIDTPETKKPNTPVMCYGEEAYKVNISQVDNKIVYLKADKENKDRYGRLLRFVFLNYEELNDINNSVNAILVKNGLARTMIISPNTTYKKDFLKMEAEAKEQKKGVWGNCSQPFIN